MGRKKLTIKEKKLRQWLREEAVDATSNLGHLNNGTKLFGAKGDLRINDDIPNLIIDSYGIVKCYNDFNSYQKSIYSSSNNVNYMLLDLEYLDDLKIEACYELNINYTITYQRESNRGLESFKISLKHLYITLLNEPDYLHTQLWNKVPKTVRRYFISKLNSKL